MEASSIRIIYTAIICAALFVFYGEPIAITQSTQNIDAVGETGELTKQTEVKPAAKVRPKPAEDKPVKQSAPEPKPTEVAPTYPVGCERYRPLVEQYDWDVRVAMAVMRAESGCNPNAANWNDSHGTCSGSFGLFQLACFWTSNPHDPTHNIAKAHEIYSRSGWQPWGAYTNGSYKKYL